VGAGVTFGGWISTFMIKIRGRETAKMVYVTTGLWVGLTAGRMSIGFLVGPCFQGRGEWLTEVLQVMSPIMLALIWAIISLIVSYGCYACRMARTDEVLLAYLIHLWPSRMRHCSL
jgi:fucose permease